MELRVGIGENHWRSLTFKIWTQGEESYAICREVPQEKQSFHRSGITRFAKITDGPRPPIHSSYLPVLRGDRYCTVGRLILTTEDNLGPARDLVRKHSFCAKHSDGLDSSVFAIGFTNCHPEQGNGIDLPENNIVTAKLSEHKYLTVTYEKQDLGTTLCSLKKHNLGPMSSSSIITTKKANPFDPSLTDFLFYYRSSKQTYTLWAHSNVKDHGEAIYCNAIRQALKSMRVADVSGEGRFYEGSGRALF